MRRRRNAPSIEWEEGDAEWRDYVNAYLPPPPRSEEESVPAWPAWESPYVDS